MYTRFELLEKAAPFLKILKQMMENPQVEQILWDKLANKQFSLEEEQVMLQSIELLLIEDDSMKELKLSLAAGLYIFGFEPHKNIEKGMSYIRQLIALNKTDKVNLEKDVAIPNDLVRAAFLLRKAYSLGNEKAKSNLEWFKEKYSFDYQIKYQCTMALEPQFAMDLLYKSPQFISNCIFYDILLKKEEKYELFLKSLRDYPSINDDDFLFVPPAVRKFTGDSVLKDSSKGEGEKYWLFATKLFPANHVSLNDDSLVSKEVKEFMVKKISENKKKRRMARKETEKRIKDKKVLSDFSTNYELEMQSKAILANELKMQSEARLATIKNDRKEREQSISTPNEFQHLLNQPFMDSEETVAAAFKMLDLGADVNTKNKNGDTLLHLLVKNREWLDLKSEDFLRKHWVSEKIQFLIGNYVVAREAINNDGLTPLGFLMQRNNVINQKKLLVEFGFNPNTLDNEGNSLLHLCAQKIDKQELPFMEKLVKDYHLNINLKDNAGLTPLDYAIESRNFSVEVAKSLIDIGAKAEPLFPCQDTLDLFDKALQHQADDDAINIFCSTSNIQNNGNLSGNSLLTKICALINKPVAGIFISKLLEYEGKRLNKETEYNLTTSTTIFASVWNKSHLILDWKSVQKYLKWVKPNIVLASNCLEENAPNLKELFQWLELDIKKVNKQSTLLQTIIKQTQASIKYSSQINAILNHLKILLEIIKKMNITNSAYIREANRTSISYFDELAKFIDEHNYSYKHRFENLVRDKMNEIINYVKSEIKYEKTSLSSLLFFNQKSLYSELPQELKCKIISNIALMQ